MTDENAKPEDAETPETVEEEAEAAEPGADAEDATTDKDAEIAELKDRLMRAVAETENVRRRAERDRSDASAYAITGFARDVLSLADNLHRTIDALPDELRADDRVKTFAEGVELTERELLATLERHGIRKVDPNVGDKLDPNRHQAMFEVETADQAPGTVVQVIQAGYVIKDRLLRPAMVGVAKAPAGGQAPGGEVDTSA